MSVQRMHEVHLIGTGDEVDDLLLLRDGKESIRVDADDCQGCGDAPEDLLEATACALSKLDH